jgi:hypothetical protein
VQLEGLDKLEKKFNDFIGNRIGDLLVLSTVPQSTTLQRTFPSVYLLVST